MIILDKFVVKWDGKFLEVAGSSNALNQCVDLANGYLRDDLELPIIKWTDAKNFPNHPIAKEHFTYIKNAPKTVPQKGDLVVWNSGTWGHIAICLYADVQSPWFTSFDQNWPIGSKCHKVDHSYTNVVGWLRPRNEDNLPSSSNNDLVECLKQHTHLISEIKKKDNTISKQEKELLKLGVEIEKTDELRKKWHGNYKQSQKNLKGCQIDRGAFQTKITKMTEKSLITASRRTLWSELIRDYLGTREVVVKNEDNS